MGESVSISLDGSQRLKKDGGWDGIIATRTKQLNLKGPSQYFQYLAEQDIYPEEVKQERMKKKEIIIYSLIILTFFALILQIVGVI